MILNDAQVTLPHGEVAYLMVSEYVVGPILLDVQAKIDAPDAIEPYNNQILGIRSVLFFGERFLASIAVRSLKRQ